MKWITVETAGTKYGIRLGAELFGSPEAVEALTPFVSSKRCMIAGDDNTLELYSEPLEQTLEASGTAGTTTYSFPPGEQSKKMATVEKLYHEAIRQDMGRDAVVFALGGGVPGDTVGFFAATYLRGIPFVQVPTSLLAMVDSSVGGKVGIDLPEGKNLVGAFYQPHLVLADLSVLQTLPEAERRCGLAEIVKTAVLFDPDLFHVLEKEADRGIPSMNPDVYEDMIARCCEWKASIVREDEKESGKRAILNYGHTFAHAIEVLSGYSTYSHGEAVAIGMTMAADFAADAGLCDAEMPARQEELLERLGLPTRCELPQASSQEVINVMYRDKKVRSSRLRLVLPTGVGGAIIRETTDHEALRKAIEGRFFG